MSKKKDKNNNENILILNNQNIDSELSLNFKLNDKDFQFPVKIIDKDEEYIYISVIKVQNKILGFANSSVKVDLILSFDNKRPIIWEDVDLETTYLKKKKISVYAVKNKTGKGFNRRGNFRIPLIIDADAQIGLHTSVEKVVVKDISSTGISIVVANDREMSDNEPIHILFYDPLVKKKINITCFLVRKQEINNKQFVYGCKFKEESEGVFKYIQERQRLDLQRLSGKMK